MFLKKKRIIYFISINVSALLFGIALVIWEKIASGTQLAVISECPFHAIFGLYCPFCGCTRSARAILEGKILMAFAYNPALPPSIIAFISYDILTFKNILQNKEKIFYIHKWVWISILSILVVNWIVRNILLVGFNIDYLASMPL